MSTRQDHPEKRRFLGRMLAVAMGVLLLVVATTACGEDPSGLALGGIVRSPAPNVGDLSLPRARDGANHYLKADQGKVLVIYFGYTACPDVCPTTMSDLSAAMEGLGDKADNIEVAMITIDPDRDSDEVLSGYVGHFAEGGYALRTDDPAVLRSAADGLGANYSVEVTEDGEIEVGHTGFLYAVDEDGELLVTWAFGTPSSEIGHDLDILLARVKA